LTASWQEGAKKLDVRKRIAEVIPRSILVERALVLKTEGNLHFKADEYSPALLLYSGAIEMLEGAGEDAALATILCNRSVAYLKLGQPSSALTDAERARALGGSRAHFRVGEALRSLRRYEEALAAFEAALANAVSECAASTLCS
jgi:tetratricopeptide (TPR) repeat protein